jgi:ATP-dependent DNA helicase RecG
MSKSGELIMVADNPKYDPRKMMEKAVEVMLESKHEKRTDGTPSPKVGAVLVRPDGTIETASRGELRDGNHAEYTLLERKCFGEKLDGSVLFSTLEPCLKRNHPKRGCAKHITSARIKEVYVGIEDENPMVAGKGIEHLERNGVTVRMFDRDLQEIILKENKDFFEWTRQQIEKPDEEPIQLSKYEEPMATIIFDDLSEDALMYYRSKAKIMPSLGSDDFMRMLCLTGLATKTGDTISPTGFGYLLFGKNPRDAMQQAGLLARVELANGESVRKEFSQAMVLIPNQLQEWLHNILPNTLDRNQMERREYVDIPFEVIREAVVNALIHRDYNLTGQKCHLHISADTIVVKSPGGPVEPITLEQIRSFSAPLKSRNPILHYVFARLGMAEEQGFGLGSLKKYAEKHGLPLPSFSIDDGGYLVLTIYRTKFAAVSTLKPDILESLSKAERQGWGWLATQETTTSSKYADLMSIPARTSQTQLKHFTDLGLLEKQGSGPATVYRVIRR